MNGSLILYGTSIFTVINTECTMLTERTMSRAANIRLDFLLPFLFVVRISAIKKPLIAPALMITSINFDSTFISNLFKIIE